MRQAHNALKNDMVDIDDDAVIIDVDNENDDEDDEDNEDGDEEMNGVEKRAHNFKEQSFWL